ncbi:hypothetical protein GCM10009549_31440 [Streptomyces thermoalcalitolerans]|uniref:Integral membrane protein n=2 Tax=Streptomyces thermoalcalitolerans TaxID=65605 RepID=A0ABP3Z7M1_9ACTN
MDICAGGVADGLAAGAAGAARAAGAAGETDRETDSTAVEAANRQRLTVFWEADTTGNVPGAGSDVPPGLSPRARSLARSSDTEGMKLSRPVSWFLLAFGVWSWVIWVTFVRNLFKDSSGLAFDDGRPTAYFWVHLALAVVSFVWGTAIGVIGLRGLRALRRKS